jgi:Flp pilus assembly protein CpaB
VRRGRPVPGSRAIVGGVLVAVAMLASFAVAANRGHGPAGRVVVVRRAVAYGAPLHADDLAIERVDLPPDLAKATLHRISEAAGGIALAPLQAGDMVERSSLSFSSAAPDREVSFPVDRARAVDGHLQAGEAVDILATYGTGLTARTLVVARRVRLVDVDADAHQALDPSGKIIVTVALRDPDAVLAATHAAQVGSITLIRATGSTDDGADSYALPPDDGSATGASGGVDPAGTGTAAGPN